MKNAYRIISYVLIMALFIPFTGCSQKSEPTVGAIDARCNGQDAHDHDHNADQHEHGAVTLTYEAMETAGIRTEQIVQRSISQARRAAGKIVLNPKRKVHVTARLEGRIDTLSAYVGNRVNKGEVLGSIYSNEFLSLQADLLQAIACSKRGSQNDSGVSLDLKMIDSTRIKLRRIGLTEEDLTSIENTGEAMNLLPIRAPISGIVIDEAIFLGDYVNLGSSLFVIADFSSVWAEIRIFEKDLANIKIGDEVSIHTPSLPVRVFQGCLFYLGSTIDETTRTIEGRIALSNSMGELRPGLFIEAEILSQDVSPALFVPNASILDFENRHVVFVKTADNVFSLRDIITGRSQAGWVEVTSGLKEGESVATDGSYFLKAELLKSGLGDPCQH